MSKAALLTGPSRALVIIYNGPNQFLVVHRIYYSLYTLKIKKVPIKLQHLSIFLQL